MVRPAGSHHLLPGKRTAPAPQVWAEYWMRPGMHGACTTSCSLLQLSAAGGLHQVTGSSIGNQSALMSQAGTHLWSPVAPHGPCSTYMLLVCVTPLLCDCRPADALELIRSTLVLEGVPHSAMGAGAASPPGEGQAAGRRVAGGRSPFVQPLLQLAAKCEEQLKNG